MILYKPSRKPYEFQRVAIEDMIERGYGFLWDEPGLGKTLQATVAAKNLAPQGPILVVCPNAVKSWWRKEIASLYPGDASKVALAREAGRFLLSGGSGHISEVSPALLFNRHPEYIWWITHYEGVRLQSKDYASIPWKVVILDESHYIKNRNAQRSQAIDKITPKDAFRLGCTATPFGKNPADLWHQLYWMCPEVEPLQSYWRFFHYFVEYERRRAPQGHMYRHVKGGKDLDKLATLMSYYGLQRTKKEVAPQLPPITSTDVPIPLEGRQRDVYDALFDQSRSEIVIKDTSEAGKQARREGRDDEAITGIIIRNALTRLVRMEQWLSCPWKFDPGTKGAKMEWLVDWAESYRYPAVILTRFKSTARAIAGELTAGLQRRDDGSGDSDSASAKMATVYAKCITGDVSQKIRDSIIDQWRRGEFPFLVGTIHTMGTGLNLQRAWALVFYDQLYDPILMEQSMHRVHRIDSDHPVEIVYLYMEGTSNELVLKSFRAKWDQMNLVKQFLQYLRTNRVGNGDDAGAAVDGSVAYSQ